MHSIFIEKSSIIGANASNKATSALKRVANQQSGTDTDIDIDRDWFLNNEKQRRIEIECCCC